jgi:YD repeat-containing protein
MTSQDDALNCLSQVTDNRLLAQGTSSAATTYSYDPASNLSSYTYPNANALQTSLTYDPLNCLTNLAVTPVSSPASLLANFADTLGAAGNRKAFAELGGHGVS